MKHYIVSNIEMVAHKRNFDSTIFLFNGCALFACLFSLAFWYFSFLQHNYWSTDDDDLIQIKFVLVLDRIKCSSHTYNNISDFRKQSLSRDTYVVR